ncbi:MAG: MTH1187 family thiamine-binding protein [Candidatus Omnitrophota bacterium]
MEICVIPVGGCEISMNKWVGASEEALKGASDIKSQITSMGTILEGESSERLFALARQMHQKAFGNGIKRVFTTIAIDQRVDK